jgi:A/G-specific adenine glycosylase
MSRAKEAAAGVAAPSDLGHRLLAWFYRNRRELPWREESDPYRIWISEVMLQQTRSENAAAYYLRWLALFPDVRALAAAPEQAVLKAWEGLGYYSRARNLRRAAQLLVERWGGGFPRSLEEALALPGVGPYTAAAVLSIAYALPFAAVDGNVLRVVSRLLADPASPASAPLLRRVRAFVESSFGRFHPGWVNQAWMELGALVCLRRPRCPLCPLSYSCRAFLEGRVAELPARVSARPLPLREAAALLLLPADLSPGLLQELSAAAARLSPQGPPAGSSATRIGELLLRGACPLLLVRRASRGLLGGLWELPNFPVPHGAAREALQAQAPRGLTLLACLPLQLRHRYSHFEARLQPCLALLRSGAVAGPRIGGSVATAALEGAAAQIEGPWVEQRWVPPAELSRYPRPGAQIRLLRLVGLDGKGLK